MNFNFTNRSFVGILAFFVFLLPSTQLLAQGCPTITDSIAIRQNVTCVSGNNGKFQFVGKGGVAPYTYTLSTISGDVTNSTGLFENLVAKEYLIKITDANGCMGTSIRKIESFTDLNTLNNSMLSYDWLADSIASSASNTYTYLTGASPALKVNGDSLAQYGAGNLNAVSKYIPIGFSFKMDNFYYDSLVIAEDGVVSFNKNINTTNYSLNQWYQNLFYTGLNTYSSPVTGESCQCDTAYLDNPLPFIAPLRDDIQANTSGAVPSQIVYKLSGTAPNRVFAVEWRNMRWNRVCNVQRDNSVSFQLELFEGSNNVKFHYKAEPNLKVNNCGGDFMGDFSTVVGYDYSAGLFGRRLGGGNYIALNPDSSKLFTNAPNVVTDAGVTTLYRGVKTENRNFPSAIGYPYGKHYEFISPPTGSCVDPLSIVSVQTTPSSGSNGTITITATGGLRKSDRYFYSKDGGKTYREGSIPAAGTIYRDTFQGLAPGTYRIAVMDNQIFQISESGTPISQSFIIQTVDVPELKIDSIIDNNISCNGLSDGKLTFKWTKTSPTGTYDVRFEKSNGTGLQTFTGITDTIKQFTGLNAGTYKITVTFNDYGSTTTATESLTNPTNVTFTSAPTTAPTCFGGSNGQMIMNVAGGTGTYMYSVDNGATFQSSNSFTNLTAGSYTIKAKDSNGCLAVTSPTVSVANGTQVTIFSLAKNNADCKGTSTGDIFIRPGTGTRPFTYSADNGATFQVDSFFKNIPAGTYPLKIKDANGCLSATTNLTINEPADFVSFTTSQTDINCTNTTGTITVTASGGSGGFQFSNNNGVNFTNSPSTPNPYTFSSLTAGTYKIKVRDVNGCSAGPTDVTINSTTGATITVNSKTDVLCNGSQSGVFNITVSGGALPYTVVVKNSSNTTITDFFGVNPYTYQNLAKDTYTITVTDGNSCVTTQNVTINEPALFYGTVSGINVTCNGANNGVITLTANGGVSPYQFSKDNGATYVSSMTSSYTFTGLTAATYFLKVKDANNCIGSTGRTITEPSAISVSINSLTNVLCHGAATGAVTLLASGGNNSSYTYRKDASTSNTTGIFTGLAVGTYVFTVTDGNSCETTKSVSITEPSPLSIGMVNTTAATCATGGTVSVTGTSGGTGSYSFALSASLTSTTGSFTNIAAGVYTLTVTDANNCTATQSVTVSGSAAPAISINSPTNIACKGAATGSFAFSVSGGTGAYTVLVKNAANSTMTGTGSNPYTYANLAAGTYTISVTDAASCSTSQSVTLTEPTTLLTPAIDAKTTAGCTVAFNATAMLSATGGMSPYTFELNGASNSTGSFTNLIAGNYTATVTDNLGCEQTINLDILSSPAVTAISETHTNITCNNANDGTITWTTTGGTTPFTFTITGGTTNTTGSFTGLSAGTYSLTYTDAKGCKAAGTPASVTIVNPAPLSIDNVSTTPATCGGGGTLSATVSGGTGSYTFKLSPSLSNTTGNFTNLSAGDYTLTVTDAKNCSTTANLTIGSSTAPSIKIGSQTDIACYGGSTGLFTFSISGGTGAYTVSVKDGSNNTVSYSGSNPYTVSTLAAGTYTISVTDAATCSATQTVTLTQPSTPLSITTTSKTNVTANGGTDGTITVTASGGTGALQFSKDNGVNYVAGTSPFTFNSLAANTYPIKVKDANNCETAATSVTVSEPDALSFTITQVNILCNGATTGSITITPSGGVSPYTYSKDDGANYSTGTSPFTFSSLAANTYKIKVKDANNVVTNATSVVITEPTPLSITMTSKADVSCNGGSNGSITVTASGGTGALQFSKDDGANYTAGTSPFTFNGLTANTYKIKVKDANNCETTASSVIVGQPTALSFMTTKTDVLCNGGSNGSITVTASGGTGALQFSKDNGVNYVAGTSPFTFNSLAANTYSIKVKDANNCETAASSVTVGQPSTPLSITTTSKTNVTANGGSDGTITVTASGGTGALQFSKDNGVNYVAGTSPFIFNSLAANTYQIKVKDANNCETAATSVTVSEPAALSFTTSQVNILCNGATTGSITITPSGGVSPYTYSKDDGANYSTGTSPFTFSSLSANTYKIKVKDANNIETNATSVVITEPTPLSITMTSKTDVACNGGNNGSITVTASGGTGALQFSKDDGANYTAGTSPFTFNSLTANTYKIKVKDANNCETAASSVTVGQPSPLSIGTVSTTPATCATGGTVTITGTTGGTIATAYTFNLSASLTNTTGSFTNIASGNYTLTVTDDNGCSATKPVNVSSSTAPTINLDAKTDVLCKGGSTGAFTFSILGGTSPFVTVVKDASNNTISGTGSNPYTYANLVAGTYIFTVTDNASCTASQSVIVTEPTTVMTPSVSIDITTGSNDVCAGTSITFTATPTNGGTTPSYQWKKNGSPVGTNAATYTDATLAGGDIISCDMTSSETCAVPPTATSNTITMKVTPTNVTISGTTTACSVVTLTASIVSSSTSLTYAWSGGNSPSSATNTFISSGLYAVTVTDSGTGCEGSSTANVTILQAPTAFSLTGGGTYCVGGSGVAIGLSNSESGVSYQLKKGTVNIGNAISGTGAAISFGNQTVSGVYTVEATSIIGECKTTMLGSATVTEPIAIVFSTPSVTNASCNGGNSGKVVVSATGGTGTITYSISPSIGTQSPSGTFNNLTAQTYTFTATDANGCTTTTTATVSTNVNTPPTVTLTSPVNGETLTSSMTLTATASDPDGTISRVNFYWVVGRTKTGVLSRQLLGSDNTAPYSYDWRNIVGGNYDIQAEAVDNCGDVTFSSISNVNVQETFTVLLSSSLNGVEFVPGSNLTLTASVVAFTSRTITKVEFFAGNVKLGEDFTAPYSYVWNNVQLGNYNLRAVATDNMGDLWYSPYLFIFGTNASGGDIRRQLFISGSARTENNIAVNNVSVFANINGLPVAGGNVSNGFFNISTDTAENMQIRLVKSSNEDATNGVTTYDIAKVSQHVLNIAPLTTPYKIIAADVDRSGDIDAIDMLHIRRFILRILPSLPGGNFRFVDKAYTFRNATMPLNESFPEVANIASLVSNTSVNFVAVKLGDVNDSYNAVSSRSAGKLIFNTNDMDLIIGNEYTVNISADKMNATAFQGTFSLEGGKVKSVQAGSLNNMTNSNFGVFANAVTTSWNGKPQDATDVLSITFVANRTGKLSDMLTVNSALTQSVANDATGNEMNVHLKFNTGKVTGGEFALYQNQPNPAAHETNIGFNLPKDGQARLTITTIDGRIVKVVSGEYKAGYNSISVNKSDLNASGIYYYHLETAEHSASKKMVIID